MPRRVPGALVVLTRPALLLLHVGAVAAVVAAFLLGKWQLDVWQEHRQDQSDALVHAAPRPLADVIGADDPFPGDKVGQPVRFSGRWVPDSTVYVANREVVGQEGFWVVTAAGTCGGTEPAGCDEPSAVPVVRGWTPRSPVDRAAPTGAVRVTGWLQPGESSAPDADPSDDVLSTLQVGTLAQRINRDLYSGYVILSSPAQARDGLTAVTPDSLPEPPSSTALRNLLYGLEWWVFGGLAVFLWWRWCRDAVEAAGGGEIPVSDDADEEEHPSEAGLPSKP